ncbi:Ectopic P granules protein 5 [Desmophyllum pertusum]|uniref:Ectopic P granules protein 5 n=1 Tax=Desmophyllum pertusum TaxID=174260 RepID=A0A9X0A9J6_9CNID|nr:Ectopic P granules protein 5 [Desmophyllum pertusum]
MLAASACCLSATIEINKSWTIVDDDGEDIRDDKLIESHYHVEHTSSRDLMRMLAFASCVVYVMGSAFRTYEKLRYRAFVKRVGRTIRLFSMCWITGQITEAGELMSVETLSTLFPDSFQGSGNQYSIQRLQVEVDQFFLRAAQQIISAHKSPSLAVKQGSHPLRLEDIFWEPFLVVHPFVISVLLEKVSLCLTCSVAYQFNCGIQHTKTWTASKSWLLKADLSAPENQLARSIVSNLNWGPIGGEVQKINHNYCKIDNTAEKPSNVSRERVDNVFLHTVLAQANGSVNLLKCQRYVYPVVPGGIAHEAI